MRLLVAFLCETILRSDLCDIKLYRYGRPNRGAAGGLRDIIYSAECEFFVDVCLCYNSNDTYFVRIKNDGIRPLRTYTSQLDYYTPGSMQLDGGDLTKMHTYLCEDVHPSADCVVATWPFSAGR